MGASVEIKLIVWGVVQAIFALIGVIHLAIMIGGKKYTGTEPRLDNLTLVEKVKVWTPFITVLLGVFVVAFHASGSLVSWLPGGLLGADDELSPRYYAQVPLAIGLTGWVFNEGYRIERLKALDQIRTGFISRVVKSFENKRRFKTDDAAFTRQLEEDLVADLTKADAYRETIGQTYYREDLLEGIRGQK